MHARDSSVVEDQVSLGANSIDGDAIGDEALNEGHHGIDFGPSVVEVVVVDEKFCGWVGFFGSAEGDVDEFGPEEVVEDGGAPGSVVVEDLVDDIPVVDLARVTAGNVGNVALDDRCQLNGIGNRGNPYVGIFSRDWNLV